MIDNSVLLSVFENYNIERIILVKDSDTYNFIISNMSSNISLDRWDFLEKVLMDILNCKVNILSFNQALNHLGKDYIERGTVLK